MQGAEVCAFQEAEKGPFCPSYFLHEKERGHQLGLSGEWDLTWMELKHCCGQGI